MNKGLYIHVPFCKSKCKYCDFSSYSGKDSLMPEYFSCMQKELLTYKEIFRQKGYTISSIFIGGGTPTLVDEKYISDLMDLIFSQFNVKSDAEISIEANPGTVRKESLDAYFQSGINRISFGLQSADNEQLRILGRIHSFSDYEKSMNLARKAGFKNINTDLIIGIPNQDLDSLSKTIDLVIGQKPCHISCYSLIIEENTPFHDLYNTGRLQLPVAEEERRMYHYAISYLREKGYNHYEISNFALEGFECQHNILYWKAEEYIGIGASAHSYFEGFRYGNVKGLEEYNKAIATGDGLRENCDMISKDESMKEFMMLGLRLIDGVKADKFRERYDEDMFDIFHGEIDKLEKLNLVTKDARGIRLTKHGLDYANIAFMEFV